MSKSSISTPWTTWAEPKDLHEVRPQLTFVAQHQNFHSYFTPARNRPCGGAVTPAFFLFLDSRIPSKIHRGELPLPTSTSVPTMVRTMWRRKPLASMVNLTKNCSSFSTRASYTSRELGSSRPSRGGTESRKIVDAFQDGCRLRDIPFDVERLEDRPAVIPLKDAGIPLLKIR